jgi:hypothetical protein
VQNSKAAETVPLSAVLTKGPVGDDFSEGEMFQTKFVEEIKKHIICSVTFFRKSFFYEILWGNRVQRGRAHNMAHAHCMLDT